MTEASPLFLTTRWTLLEESSGPKSGNALDELCRNYWRPVHSFLRRSGCPEADAQDLTQDFFVTFMGRDGFAQAERGKGRFRSFLLSCVRNHFTNAWKASTRLKRGGGIDFMEVNDELDASNGLTPDEIFEKRWAEDLVDRALANLRDEWVAKDRPFKLLAPYLSGDRGAPPLSDTADKLGVSLAATKSAVHRLRKRFGELVKQEVSKSVSSREDEADELEYLLQLLSM
jgi:RNA polymerase sigma-70 factor (ECF subfamily)